MLDAFRFIESVWYKESGLSIPLLDKDLNNGIVLGLRKHKDNFSVGFQHVLLFGCQEEQSNMIHNLLHRHLNPFSSSRITLRNRHSPKNIKHPLIKLQPIPLTVWRVQADREVRMPVTRP